MRFRPSRFQIVLLVWGVCALVAAEIIRYSAASEKTETLIGLVEVLVAIATGLAIGWTILRKSKT